jgi:hypothetical protein
MPPPSAPLVDRLLARLDRSGDCWLWTRYVRPSGYAVFGGRYIHRLAFELLVGPIPEGMEIDHLCRNRSCANPAHLEPVTRPENLRRGETFAAENAAKTHCLHGHEFTPANTSRRGGAPLSPMPGETRARAQGSQEGCSWRLTSRPGSLTTSITSRRSGARFPTPSAGPSGRPRASSITPSGSASRRTRTAASAFPGAAAVRSSSRRLRTCGARRRPGAGSRTYRTGSGSPSSTPTAAGTAVTGAARATSPSRSSSRPTSATPRSGAPPIRGPRSS